MGERPLRCRILPGMLRWNSGHLTYRNPPRISKGAITIARNSDVCECEGAHNERCRGDTVGCVLQSPVSGQDGDRRQGDGDLDECGCLGPAMVDMHRSLTLLLGGLGGVFELLGLGHDLV